MKNWQIILIVSTLMVLVSSYFLFVFDIGLNSKYFIKRDFDSAFLARQAGNCDIFKEYIAEDFKERWEERCIEEKKLEGDYRPIKHFSIQNISIDNNKAFLRVEMERDPTLQQKALLEKEYGGKLDLKYSVNYDMTKIRYKNFLHILPITRWIILQELK
jgi:hypothetical protein